ncbi:MAG: STAS domain-containing protein [Proteobacteria bacterium]|nr:STAS domain-containing protein [Pseudomonadota bacterium]
MNEMSRKDIVTIMLPERVDSVTALKVQKSMLDALKPGAQVIVDGSAVSYMSAAGVRALATALRSAGHQRARVVFCSFSGAAEDCLLVAGFAQLLDVVPSHADAEAKLGAKPVGNHEERLHARGAAG